MTNPFRRPLAAVAILSFTSLQAAAAISIAPAVQISVPTDPDIHYELQTSSDLNAPVWSPVVPIRRGLGKPLLFNIPITPSGPAFFRVQTYDLTNGLVAWHPFNGSHRDELNPDYFSSSNDLMITNRFGTAFGAYDATIGQSSVPFQTEPRSFVSPTSTNFTISFWFLPTYFRNSPASQGYTNFWFQTALDYSLRLQIRRNADEPDNTGHLDLFTVGVANPILTTSLIEFNLTQWENLQLIRDGNTFSLLIDGNMVARSESSVVINRIPYRPLRFNGAIDDLRLYNRALNPAELATLRRSED